MLIKSPCSIIIEIPPSDKELFFAKCSNLLPLFCQFWDRPPLQNQSKIMLQRSTDDVQHYIISQGTLHEQHQQTGEVFQDFSHAL